MINEELVFEALKWFVAIGSGLVAYWIMERPLVVGWLKIFAVWTKQNLDINRPLLKRLVAGALGLVLALAGYLVQAAFGLAAVPVGVIQWFALILGLAGASFPTSQLIHGFRELGRGNG